MLENAHKSGGDIRKKPQYDNNEEELTVVVDRPLREDFSGEESGKKYESPILNKQQDIVYEIFTGLCQKYTCNKITFQMLDTFVVPTTDKYWFSFQHPYAFILECNQRPSTTSWKIAETVDNDGSAELVACSKKTYENVRASVWKEMQNRSYTG